MSFSLIQGINRARARRGRGIAVVDGPVRLTWEQVADRTSRLAAALRRLGVADGERVAVLAFNSAEVYEIFFATLWAGGMVAPLNHRLSTPELADQAKRAAPSVLFFRSEFAAEAAALQPALHDTRFIQIDTGDGAYGDLIAHAMPIPPSERCGDAAALLFFTGGTTGEPKGVLLSHANMCANSINFITEMKLDERTVHLHCGPLFHVASAARLFSVTQLAGTHVILPRFEADAVLDAIARERITLATFVPTMIRSLLDALDSRSSDFSSLEYITYGAAPMPEALLCELMDRLPHVKLVQSYGMTETSPIATMLGHQDHLASDTRPARLRSAGRAALLAEVRILDAAGNSVPAGTPGEVVVRGPMVMKGYWQAPQATAAVLRNGWMHTGDVGHLDADGYLFVVDRLKDVIISGGENIYSQEVESAISAHPAVKTCAVIGRPDKKWGEAVHAIVVPRPGMAVTPEAIIAHCRAAIASYKCPKTVEIRHSDLPLTGANKIDKARLRRALLVEADS